MLSSPKIVILLPTTQVNPIIGKPFTELSETDSTNTHVMSLIRQGENVSHGAAWLAHIQTQGKGQRGKTWVSEPGKNVMLSIALQPHMIPVTNQFELSIVVALAVHDILKNEHNDCYIKWPNDIYCDNKKVCGILIENIIKGSNWQWAVAGIGINLNQTRFDSNLAHVSSLKLLTGKEYNIISFAKDVCASLEKRYLRWQKVNFATLMQEYNDNLYKRGQKVRFKKRDDIFDCIIDSVDNKGYLHVSGSIEKCFSFGEVELLQ